MGLGATRVQDSPAGEMRGVPGANVVAAGLPVYFFPIMKDLPWFKLVLTRQQGGFCRALCPLFLGHLESPRSTSTPSVHTAGQSSPLSVPARGKLLILSFHLLLGGGVPRLHISKGWPGLPAMVSPVRSISGGASSLSDHLLPREAEISCPVKSCPNS